jgi:replicative DNA helicase
MKELFSREAEEAVIGSVLINPEIFDELEPILKTSMSFYIHRNRWIWEAIQKIKQKKFDIDLLTVAAQLEEQGQLTEIGGRAYMTSLVNQVPSSLSATSYAQVVRSRAERRAMVQVANEIAKLSYSDESEVPEIRDKLSKMLNAILLGEQRDGESISSVLSRHYDKVLSNSQAIANSKPVDVGLMTGFHDLDHILIGIEAEELVIIAGRPGHGKSAILMNLLRAMTLKQQKHAAIFSQEMSNDEIIRRLVAQESSINTQQLKNGALSQDEWPRFTDAMERLSNLSIWMDDASNLTPSGLRSKCLKLKHTKGLDVVFVDYIQIMNAEGKKSDGNRVQEVSYITRSLKLLAKELKCPVIAASQLNRANEMRSDRRPVLSDLRDSGSIEQDANTVIFIHRPDMYTSNDAEVIVAKRRDGAVGKCELVYLPEVTRFESKAKTYQQAQMPTKIKS